MIVNYFDLPISLEYDLEKNDCFKEIKIFRSITSFSSFAVNMLHKICVKDDIAQVSSLIKHMIAFLCIVHDFHRDECHSSFA